VNEGVLRNNTHSIVLVEEVLNVSMAF